MFYLLQWIESQENTVPFIAEAKLLYCFCYYILIKLKKKTSSTYIFSNISEDH